MPLIFISHAALDSVIAKQFQDDVKRDFLGMCDVFVSSNLDSLQAGYEWNNVIKKKLSDCSILIGLLSPKALQRPWVYVEFGAAWIRDIAAIPVCHSGLDRGNLPAPISNFQALNLSEGDHIGHLYDRISSAIGCQSPSVDFQARSVSYFQKTEAIRIERQVLAWIRQIFEWNPNFEARLRTGVVDEDVAIPANLDLAFREFSLEALKREYLVAESFGMAMGTRVGAQAAIYKIAPGRKVAELLGYLDAK